MPPRPGDAHTASPSPLPGKALTARSLTPRRHPHHHIGGRPRPEITTQSQINPRRPRQTTTKKSIAMPSLAPTKASSWPGQRQPKTKKLGQGHHSGASSQRQPVPRQLPRHVMMIPVSFYRGKQGCQQWHQTRDLSEGQRGHQSQRGHQARDFSSINANTGFHAHASFHAGYHAHAGFHAHPGAHNCEQNRPTMLTRSTMPQKWRA